jgi:putative holo-[acyl-carrier-protein] synthase
MENICNIDVVFAHNDESITEPFSPPKHLTERQLKRWKSRRMTKFLLKTLLEKHGFDPNLAEQIQRAKNGRPYFAQQEIDFNITHSGDYVAIIFAKATNGERSPVVGIDLEHPQKIRRFEPLIRHYADAVETEQLLEKPQILTNLAERFYLSWCLREAVLKSQGVGIMKLSEVTHRPNEKTIKSQHCPQGVLHFYHQFPFFLAYFFGVHNKCQLDLWEWEKDGLQKNCAFQPLIYSVNEGISYE